ncbi:uncharacterized protein LOC143558643 [Bidens hawaiensis]|uniref:uncharacterized protein LOC143558643 n=1 Tax=Bidens hawaiensis TaxID=980011 RepID=UPI00404A2E0C
MLITTVHLEVERCTDPTSETRTFKRIYVCLGPLKQGFKAIGRDLLGLDGAFLKSAWPGQLLTAVGLDPNNGYYPLAYAVVEAETMLSWQWFLQCLGDDLGLDSRSKFTFMSDIQKKLAACTTPAHYEREMHILKRLNKKAHLWVSKIPPEHWSRSHFTGRCLDHIIHYFVTIGRALSDVYTNNMCEVFHSKLVDGRDKPIITLLEYIREYLMRKIVNVLKVIDKSSGLLTPLLLRYNVQWKGEEHYQVTGPNGDQCVVNMRTNTCACRRWEVTGIPCRHAVENIWVKATHDPSVGTETFVNPVYTMERPKESKKKSVVEVEDSKKGKKVKKPNDKGVEVEEQGPSKKAKTVKKSRPPGSNT